MVEGKFGVSVGWDRSIEVVVVRSGTRDWMLKEQSRRVSLTE